MKNLLSKITLNPKSPALDPYMVDFTGEDIDNLSTVVNNAILHLNNRMFACGIKKYHRAILCDKSYRSILRKTTSETIITYNYCQKGCLYVLTRCVDGRIIIHPPYSGYYDDIMPWDEFIAKMMIGDDVNLVIEMPFLQAKIFNIGVNDDNNK